MIEKHPEKPWDSSAWVTWVTTSVATGNPNILWSLLTIKTFFDFKKIDFRSLFPTS